MTDIKRAQQVVSLPGRRVSIEQVAQLASVSRATAARAVTGSGPVADKTRKRVLAAAAQLNYHPDPMARALAGGRTNTVGVLWSACGNPEAPYMIRSITLRLQERGYLTHFSDESVDFKTFKRMLDDYARHRLDGLVLQDGPFNTLSDDEYGDLFKPFGAVVVVTRRSRRIPGIDIIARNRDIGTFQIAQHFVRSGRKRFGAYFLNLPGDDKLRGYRAGLADHGFSLSDADVIRSNYRGSLDESSVAIDTFHRQFDGKPFPYDALLCGNDQTALVAMNYLRSRGLRIGQDVAVAGFNNVPFTGYVDPPLASVDFNTSRTLELIEKFLFERLTDPHRTEQAVTLPMEFIWRASAGGDACLADPVDKVTLRFPAKAGAFTT